MQNNIAEKINTILPQTQCGQCTFKGCKPYSEAIIKGTADINQCPPGGKDVIKKIAKLLNVDYKPLDKKFGVNKPISTAIINEAECIGCTLCIAACPVDSILGAGKQMHTVIENECTGCELCIKPCPVDCIEMKPLAIKPNDFIKRKRADLARERYEFRNFRIARDKKEANMKRKMRVSDKEKKLAIADAIARINNE